MQEGQSEMLPRVPFLSLNIGHVLTITSTLIGGFAAYYGVVGRLDLQDLRLSNVEQTVKSTEKSLALLTTLAVDNARRDEKVLSLERRIDRVELDLVRARVPPP